MENEQVLEGYLYCRKCFNVLKYSPKQTSNLSRHKCCQLLKEPAVLKSVAAEDKKAADNVCVAWVSKDCQPFSAISGSGFMELAKFLINIGAKYGEQVDVEALLPNAITLSRTTQKLADEKKLQIKDEISEAVQNGGASATIDLWTDNFVHRHFLGVTLHYQKNFKFYDIILGLKSMEFERSTGSNIRSKLLSLFEEFGINNIDEIKFITDRGSNVVKALENNVRLNCSSHLLANVLEHSFKETEELKELVEACKKIVKYFKKANLQHQLPTSLKNECPTRWNSNFTMFKSIVDNWYHINEILKGKEESQRLLLISISTLKELVDLCDDFDTIFKKLQLCSSPSLYYVIPSIQKVKKLCVSKTTDVSAIASLKEKINGNIDKIWLANISLWHKTAFFLYPPANKLQHADLHEIKNFCISLINNMALSLPSASSHSITENPSTPDSTTQFSFVESSASKDIEPSTSSQFKKDFNFFFSELIPIHNLSTPNSPAEEIELYCKENVILSEEFDIIRWWKSSEKSFPNLSKIAVQIHAIPASSAAAERAFSLAGNVITEKRNRLGPKSVNSLLFLHSYFKNFEA